MRCILIAASFISLTFAAGARGASVQSAPARFPAGAAATFIGLGGAPRTITMEEFESYIAKRYAKDSLGKDAINYIIQDAVLEKEIERRGTVISPSELRDAISVMETQLKQATGRTLDEELVNKGMDRATFEGFYKKQIACERMARADLGLAAGDTLRPDQQQLWISERVKAAKVQREELPSGIIINIDGRAVTAVEVGHMIRLKMSRKDIGDAAAACGGIRIIEDAAAFNKVTINDSDITDAIARRKERFASNPMMAGVQFEQFIQARGYTIDDLRADAAVRAEALLWNVAMQQLPDAEVDKRYADSRERYDGLFGEQRKLSWILIFAGHVKSELIKKTYEEADEELKQMIPRIHSAAEFGRLAVLYSKHEDTRKNNGELGWLHRREPNHDIPVLNAAFAPDAKIGTVLGPVHTDAGSALLYLHATKPAPEITIMRRFVRSDLTGDLYRRLFQDAKLTTFLDAPKNGAGK